jgi:hypothetical protein
MIVVIPAPNDDNAPGTMVDDNVVTGATVTSSMSRNTTLLPSIWTAA